MPKYGLVGSDYTPRLAHTSVGRWNDGRKRHTLYTVCGTTQDGWGLVQAANDVGVKILNMVSPDGPFTLAQLQALVGKRAPDWAVSPDTAVGAAANPNLFNWVAVSYPAAPGGGPTWPQNLSLSQSVQVGVDELTRLIENTQGTFAICAMSQGSVVASKVLQSLLGGRLASRAGDCIAAITFGNPMRQIKATFPNGTPSSVVIVNTSRTGTSISTRYYGGGVLNGVAPASPLLTGNSSIVMPSWWWEMSTPGDFFSDAPMETVAGPLIGEVARALISIDGSSDMIGAFANAGRAFLTGNITPEVLINSTIKLLASKREVQNIVSNWAGTLLSLIGLGNGKPNGHMLYGTTSPPTLPPGLSFPRAKPTYIEVALAYLHARGNAITPR